MAYHMIIPENVLLRVYVLKLCDDMFYSCLLVPFGMGHKLALPFLY